MQLADVTIVDTDIVNNVADHQGGGLWNFASTVTIADSTISGNSAQDSGGGIENTGRYTAAVGTMSWVHRTGRLPECYLTKRRAEERGWRPGSDLWRVAPGHSIGGDNFGNREGRLPPRGRYVEADLDYAGGRRGAARLVFVRDSRGRWLQWITTDHYRTFQEVPAPHER